MPTPAAVALASSPLFQIRDQWMSNEERVKLSYRRSEAIVKTYNLTKEDLRDATPAYWDWHSDPLLVSAGAVATLLTIHNNLCGGTLAAFSAGRPDVDEVLQKLLKFEINGQYCLTELGHGLDAPNLETTATLLPNGEYELNTPHDKAAKFMPPTSPSGVPCVSIIYARLIANGENRGVKPFMVFLHDGKTMNEGVVSKPLAYRGGSGPVKHCLTYFHHVRLPTNALLGSAEKAKDPKADFFINIQRVIVGTLSMGALGVSAMRIASHVAGTYSLRRTVTDGTSGKQRPIATFSTQHTPILTAIAQSLVFSEFYPTAWKYFSLKTTSLPQKHFMAATFKATVMKHTHSITVDLANRCGAQGLAEVNQITLLHSDMRGAAIAEGDTLAISIKFAVEHALGRVALPVTTNPDSLMAKHETFLVSELRSVLASSKSHRNPEVEAAILPLCQPIIEAIGYRIAYDAGVAAGLPKALLDLFVASIMKFDSAWYSEQAGISRAEQKKLEATSAAALFPRMQELIDSLNVKPYISAPIVTDASWNGYVDSWEIFGVPQRLTPTVLPQAHNSQQVGARL